VLFGAVGAVAAVVALVLILVSVVGSSDSKNATPTTAAAAASGDGSRVPGAAASVALFKGIPQQLNVLGKATAPVTMVEFADLQCPFCRDYSLSALPSLVTRYVRTGKAKFVFSGMHFLGPDSERALRAAFAAGLQNKFWPFVDLMYRNQGPENSGWVTEDLIRSVGKSIPGLDTPRLLADMGSAEVTNAIAVADQQSQSAGVNQTPTFFAGKTGETLQHVGVSKLAPEAFQPTLDALAG
jgi:protein-disulfide isomerase